mgnify:CR=1 FL=1
MTSPRRRLERRQRKQGSPGGSRSPRGKVSEIELSELKAILARAKAGPLGDAGQRGRPVVRDLDRVIDRLARKHRAVAQKDTGHTILAASALNGRHLGQRHQYEGTVLQARMRKDQLLGRAQALLIGGIVASTDGAAVFALLRGSTLRKRLARTLEAEAGLNDPVAILLVVGFIEWIKAPGTYGVLNMLGLFGENPGVAEPALPCDVQLCELANPAKWQNQEDRKSVV